MLRFSTFGVIALFSGPFAQSVLVSKTDFPRFAGVVACGALSGDLCPGAEDGLEKHGLVGDSEMPDPTDAALARGGRVVLGFLEGKPFAWTRYSVEYPNSGWKWVVLNELSVSEKNRVFLTLWKHNGSSLDLIKVFPRTFPLALGETTVHSQTRLPDGSMLVILRGEGSESGVRLQDYRFLKLKTPDKLVEVYRRTNRSEIPVDRIMERLNADELVEAVMDSTLSCEVAKTKAPSGGPLIRFTVSRTKVLYTKAGPEETPDRATRDEVDIWKTAKVLQP